MNVFVLFTLFVYVTSVTADDCERRCGENEVYLQCGSACPTTCGNRNETFACTDNCVSGCFCKAGFVLDDNKVCVAESSCPQVPVCAANEVYNACGTACPPTCALSKRPCTKQCVPGCQCKEGYIRNSLNICIPEKECPQVPVCGKNQIYNECGSACPATCSKQGPQICTLQCVPGCHCQSGFLRDAQNNCVPSSECPPSCGKNEVFDTCGSACPATCANRKPLMCTMLCVIGCRCQDGFVRDDQNNCVLPSECPAAPCS